MPIESSYKPTRRANPQIAQLPEQYRQQLRSNILEQLIQQRVIDNYLEEAGYQISDEQVTAMIQRAPDFQVDGKFDLETYRTLLAQAGYDPARFFRSGAARSAATRAAAARITRISTRIAGAIPTLPEPVCGAACRDDGSD
jgi:hypothetical protein